MYCLARLFSLLYSSHSPTLYDAFACFAFTNDNTANTVQNKKNERRQVICSRSWNLGWFSSPISTVWLVVRMGADGAMTLGVVVRSNGFGFSGGESVGGVGAILDGGSDLVRSFWNFAIR